MKFDIFIVLNWADKDSQKGFCASFVLSTQFVEKSSKNITILSCFFKTAQ